MTFKTFSHLNVAAGGVHFMGTPDHYPKVKHLPAGMYTTGYDPFKQMIFTPASVETDQIISLKKSVAQAVIEEIDMFLTPEVKQAFKDYNFMYRRGVLLYGPPGTGKTSTVIDIAREFIKRHDGLVLLNCRTSHISDFIKAYRQVDPARLFLVTLEEIDGRIDDGEETSLLNLLDGEDSLDNTIYLATTNYINEMPPRFKNRPSRFASVIEIGYPDRDVRKAFLEKKLLSKDRERLNVNQLADATEGFTIDHLKDLIVTVCCLNLHPDVAVKRLKEMIESGVGLED